MLAIDCKLLSPLAQIASSDKTQTGGIIIKVKSIITGHPTGMTDESGNEQILPVRIPCYTANGFRGLLRRKASEIIAEAATDKGLTLTRSNFHLFYAGGGNNYANPLSYDTTNKIKELNPIVSLFGASLAVEGLLIVTNLLPDNPMISMHENSKDGSFYAKSGAIRQTTLITKDDILSHTKYARFLSRHDIEEWEKYADKEHNDRDQEKKDKVDKESKTKKTTIKNIFTKEYVIPGLTLHCSISSKQPLNKIEYGLLLRALESTCNEQLGSSVNIGFGYTEYIIRNKSDEIIITSSRDPKLLSDCETTLIEDKNVEAFDKWLDNLKQENISIAELLS